MTTRAIVSPAARSVRDIVLAGLAGVLAVYLTVLAWGLVSSAIWGGAWRLAHFLDPTTPLPTGYRIGSLLCTAVVGAGLGAVLARALGRGARWAGWGAFAAGAVVGTAGLASPAQWPLVLLVFLASSALGFRFGARA
jgi:hypothetical protein